MTVELKEGDRTKLNIAGVLHRWSIKKPAIICIYIYIYLVQERFDLLLYVCIFFLKQRPVNSI